MMKKSILIFFLFCLFVGGIFFFNNHPKVIADTQYEKDWGPLPSSLEVKNDQLYKDSYIDSICYNDFFRRQTCISGFSLNKDFISPDINSFQVNNKYNNFSRDKNHLYYVDFENDFEVVLDNIDFSTFKIINQDIFKDKNNVYINSKNEIDKIKKADWLDAGTVEVLSPTIIKDKNGLYISPPYKNNFYAIKNIDVNSFEVKNDYFYTDKNSVYLPLDQYPFLVKIEGADPKSFEIIQPVISEDDHQKLYTFGKDRSSVYYGNHKIEGADPHTFLLLDAFYSKDANNAFYLDKKVDDVDLKTFKVLGFGDAKDKHHIYESGQVVKSELSLLPNEFDVRQVEVGDRVAGMKITAIDKVKNNFPLDSENCFVSFTGSVTLKGTYYNVSKKTAENEPFSFGEGYVAFNVSDPESLRKLPDVFPDGKNNDGAYFEFSNTELAKKFFGPEDSSGEAEITINNYKIMVYPAEIGAPSVDLVKVFSKREK